jgi:alkylation response protein AidB-like acyl-CoA dehydrogenase
MFVMLFFGNFVGNARQYVAFADKPHNLHPKSFAMNFDLSPEHLMIRDAARDFTRTELLPGVIDRDEKSECPTEQLRKMGELGFMGMMVSEKYGGGGMDTVAYTVAIEEISKVDSSASVAMSVNNSLVCWGLEAYGTEEQKLKYLVPLAQGKILGAFCLSEPEAGSDATRQRTTAVDMGDYYLLNGVKNWITNGSSASVYLVFAQTHVELGHRGINVLIVERGMEGFRVGNKENKMGMRGSDTHQLMFDNVRVPKENRVGAEGFGFKFAMRTLEGGRIGIAAQALGIAQGAYELALAYSKQRKTFGSLIAKHQAIAFKLAEMFVEIEASRYLVWKAASDKDAHRDYALSSAMAKYKAAEMAMKVTTDAVQIHGGYGYVKEYHVERLMRDAKLTQIYEGTSEIQLMVISRTIIDL